MLHPWKKAANTCNIEESVRSNYCAYHQKFCSDEFKRHAKKPVKINVPNKHALCTECFILKEGQQPENLRRIHGVKRKTTSKHNRGKEKNRTKSILVREMTQTKADETSEDYLKKVVAAKQIQCKWRIRKKQIEEEKNLYEKHLCYNNAALKVQAWFRDLPRENTDDKLVLESTKKARTFSSRNKMMLQNYVMEHQELTDQLESDNFFICNRIQNLSEGQIQSKVNQTKAKKKLTHNSKAMRKCKLASCQLCNMKSTQPLHRQIIQLIPPFHQPGSVSSRAKILADETCFKVEDPFDIGIIGKAKFESLLIKLWKKMGQPLPLEELESIVNTFSCRNGFINYEAYLDFARQQSMPCSVHGRFLCTSPKCVKRICSEGNLLCDRFTPSSPNSNFCKCGRYISRHKKESKQKTIPTSKRGLELFSQDDMNHTFARHTFPDVKTPLRFSSLESIFRVSDFWPYNLIRREVHPIVLSIIILL